MVTRDTKTGGVLEQLVLPVLTAAGYTWRKQVVIGKRPGGRAHKIDVLAKDDKAREILISVKWQQVSGTAEEKVPFEIICLADALRLSGRYAAAYLVLGGNGWSLRDFYTSGGLRSHLTHAHLVRVLTLEDFIAKVNRGTL